MSCHNYYLLNVAPADEEEEDVSIDAFKEAFLPVVFPNLYETKQSKSDTNP